MSQLAIIEPGELELESLNAVEVFVPKGIMPIVDRIRKDVKSEILDVTTPDGRKRIASLAYKVAKAKTFLDNMGKDLTEDWKAKSKIVDAERKIARDELDALKDEIRKPLTDWENAEQERVDRLKGIIEKADAFGKEASELWAKLTIVQMEQYKNFIDNAFHDIQWDEFEDWATEVYRSSMAAIETAIYQRGKYDAEQLELAQLRHEKEERERRDREQKIAEEAAAKARAEAEAEAARAAQKAKEESEAAVKAEKERSDAAARKAADEAAAAQRRIEQAQRDTQLAKEQAEKAKADAERLAAIAVERERQRQIDEEREAAEAKAEREANKAHKSEVDTNAANAIKFIIEGQHPDDNSDTLAREIVEAIAEGRIPCVKINY